MNHTSVQVGEMVPAFTLLASNGERVSITDYRGKKVVIYFYPRDMTPGCTIESCDFRDYNGEFAEMNAEVIGISPDDLSSHQQFVGEQRLPFLLLSDTEHHVAESFGVWKERVRDGKTSMGIERSTFLLDEEGRLVKEWRKVDVDGHVKDVLNSIT